MTAQEINDDEFTGNSKYIGTVFNGCEVIGCRNRDKQFLLKCEKCGNKFLKNRTTVVLNKVKCKCSYERKTRHTDGFCNTKLKSIYLNILDRCYNNKNHAYEHYGERGITVCDEWVNDFRLFYDWSISNGYEIGLSIDRKDNNKGYSPDNCRWATRKEQANNRRTNVLIRYNSGIYTIMQLSELLGVNYRTLYSQIRRGKYECV